MMHFGGMSEDKNCKRKGRTAGREGIRAGYYEKGDSEEKVLSVINTFTGYLQRKRKSWCRGKKSRELVENI